MKSMKNESILILICLALIILVGWLFDKPRLAALKSQNTDIVAKQQEVTDTQKKIDDLKTVAGQMKAADAQIQLLNLAYPSDAGIPEILVSVEAMVGRAGLTVVSIAPSAGESSSGGTAESGQVPVNIIASGSFSNLLSFTQILEKNLRPIKIKSISISAQAADSASSSASFSIALLYQPASQASSSSAQTNASATEEGAASGTTAPTPQATP
ncbi:MAG: hypothetical protein COX39_00300 [Candidatus Nealsonbacteria bacterium CG23_combo_of_CG06-09_8_20_14_all_40_13]|uniref:Pilus assembly protein PilO n=1 Tax=Candidatus Nealsonbacteria bacterium CG23_combo_of_CG06-09_8_20_14_all_40_13 TaxID=1974724 RepID=A0A2G9YRQ5_9BACT|nr:MAG: hypothetical protein COX39_00300 [Candidatus Nealsonbacteria bacterium CG23_combo_of_CG06-09_8_20_14_all_40_13]PIR70722.1 MAG: hypothetical protein COU44_03555 [Candidatus Nealsonbacteria bacterium CG10_big_fil_rev_8_21_14_0_10_40_24]PIU42989.1 MAG: hypothetical protein COS97_03465 [Candidatus Nealsonbacteria bacterium CG07_land_8_20_14_0_80_40_10]